MKLFKASLFAVSVCTLACQASIAQAENISLRLGYSLDRNGLVIKPMKAQIGEFALSHSLPDHAPGKQVRIQAKNNRGEVLYEVTAHRPDERNIEIFNERTGAIEHARTVPDTNGVMEVSMPFHKDVVSIEVLDNEVAAPESRDTRGRERGERLMDAPRFGRFAGINAAERVSNLPLARFERSTLEKLMVNNRMAPPPAGVKSTDIVINGANSTHMDFVFVGDGYTAAEMGKWASDAQAVINGYMADPLFAANRAKINVRRVDVPSNQSGVDQIDLGIYKDTAMDGVFGCYNTPRLLCVNNAKVLDIVGSVLAPDARDVIVVISNTTIYGGAGGSIATATMHASGIEVTLHEIGHTAFALADEYTYGTCDLSSEPAQANVSRNWDRSVKWGAQISVNTPVPTPPGMVAVGTVGTFQGAQYCTSGKYRPTEDSRMRTLGKPWYAVNEGLAAKVFAKYTGGSGAGNTQSGTLSAGGSASVPSASPSYFQAGSGTVSAQMAGSAGTNFDLYLYRYNATSQAWTVVAQSRSTTSTETLSYNGAAGYYYLKVQSYSGSGSYTVNYQYPPK